ncbi:MAG TPA: plastocyanin/azurin family copper-binding protein [Acidimicrobiales bacterium]|nr:plastocyanin/azurin family copper-binding protein [Acidimicrobiales bacterium]
MRRHLLLVLPLLVVAGLGSIGVSTPGAEGDDERAAPADGAVDITDFRFRPEDVTVPAGTAVTWTNRDGSPHSIQDDSGQQLFPESEDLGRGDDFAFTYAEPGTYAYLCGIHNYMTGTVTVTG